MFPALSLSLLLFAASARGAEEGPDPAQIRARNRALVEQDLAICYEKLGRAEDAIRHYRRALALDPFLKTPWANLAVHAFNDGSPERAAHLASVAHYLDPHYAFARDLLSQAQAQLPPEPERRHEVPPACPAANEKGSRSPGQGSARDATPTDDEAVAAALRGCLESRAGWASGLGEMAARPLGALAELEERAGNAAAAALMRVLAASASPPEPFGLAAALDRLGSPCEAAEVQEGEPASAYAAACERLREGRRRVEMSLEDLLRDDLDREGALRRIESLLALGMDPDEVARRSRFELLRGDRPFTDAGAAAIRLGEEWFEAPEPATPAARVWRRRPGDSVFVVLVLEARDEDATKALHRLLASRRPGGLQWATEQLAATDPVRVRTAALALDTNDGGRVKGRIWLAEAEGTAGGRALVIAGFGGHGGLGEQGQAQAGEEIREAVEGAVLVPSRWSELTAMGPEDELPLPIPGRDGGEEPDEREMSWRVFPMREGASVALPPGSVAVRPDLAPRRSAPDRPTAALWFRSRFVDRDGVHVAVGSDRLAGVVDIQPTVEAAPDDLAALSGLAQSLAPLADPGAKLLSLADATRLLGPETGASQVLVARYQASSGNVEWIVSRLTYATRTIEVSIPALSGTKSIALYWIPSTIRSAPGDPPRPPIDLSDRMGVAFVRPPPSERREAFYKEGDLRSRDFTLLVPRGFQVSLNSGSLDGFPIRFSHGRGGALARLERYGPDEAGPMAGSKASSVSRRSLDPATLAYIGAWLEQEGFALLEDGTVETHVRASRRGSLGGFEARFQARPPRAPAGGALRPGSSTSPVSREDPQGGPDAAGRAHWFTSRDGRTYLLLAIAWGPEARQREDELDLMTRSLRLLGRTRDKPGK